MQRQRGLTLLELLVVLTIMGLVSVGVGLALRDSSQTQLEREAQRLVAVLEAGRAQSRTSGMPLWWRPTPEGFVLASPAGLTPQTTPPARDERWLSTGTSAYVAMAGASNRNAAAPEGQVVLGPEPILAPAYIVLRVVTAANTPAHSLRVGTDGLRPFQVQP